jgi:hypothetical protein
MAKFSGEQIGTIIGQHLAQGIDGAVKSMKDAGIAADDESWEIAKATMFTVLLSAAAGQGLKSGLSEEAFVQEAREAHRRRKRQHLNVAVVAQKTRH